MRRAYWLRTVRKLRQAQSNDSKFHLKMRGLTPFVRRKIEKTLEFAAKCNVRCATRRLSEQG